MSDILNARVTGKFNWPENDREIKLDDTRVTYTNSK